GALEPLALKVMAAGPRAADREPARPGRPAPAHPTPLSEGQGLRIIQEAAAAVQASQSAWTEADLIRRLGERLPAQVGAMTADAAATLLPVMAKRALATGATMLSAPEWPQVPDCLRRASGESRYVPHGAARYATGVQLTMEERH